jgi:hypothetical protein
MRAQVPLAVLVVACSGCANASALRAHADRRAPIVPRQFSAPLEPATGFVLVNPLACASGGGGSDPYAALLVVACVGVLGAVDLVALPIQALRRHGQWRDLERIGAACPVMDPSARLAGNLADVMVRDFGFSPPRPDSSLAPQDAVILEVRTMKFTRSSRIAWEGNIVFRAREDGVLWRDSCEAEAPARDAETFCQECEAARGEIAALADQCVESVVRRLRKAWSVEQPLAASPTTNANWR